MTRKLCYLFALLMTGCHVTAGVYIEKDYWTNTDVFTRPDIRTKAKLEVSREFAPPPPKP